MKNIQNLCDRVISETKPKALGIIVLIFFLGFTLPAKAQLIFCNKSINNKVSNIAIGHFANGNWISQGWYNVPQGECITVLSRIPSRYYYYYDASTDLDLVPAKAKGDEVVFCVTDQPFKILLHQNCVNNEHQKKAFSRLDTGSYTSFQKDLLSLGQVEQGIIDLVRTTRKSLISNSRVMIMRNNKPHYVSFSLQCSRPSGLTKRFNVSVPPFGFSELGFLQGWPENFLPGDQCTAFWQDEVLWTFNPY